VIGTEPCPFALQVRAALRLRAGDPVGAISDWTELAARSPERRSAYADSIRRVSSRFDSTGWYERVEEREREQWLRTLAEPVRTPEGETSLVEANGQIVPLTTMLAEGPLVVMLTTEAGLRDQAAQTVKAMASGVSPLSIRWITVVRGSPHPIALPDTSMASILPAYFDPHGELGEAVGQRRMHEYIVFDTGGRIRYQTGNAYLARRRAVLLTTVR
jgi:hypothetical protein